MLGRRAARRAAIRVAFALLLAPLFALRRQNNRPSPSTDLPRHEPQQIRPSIEHRGRHTGAGRYPDT